MSASTLAFGSTLNDSGEIEDLDFGPTILEDAGDSGEGGEGVGGDFGFCLCDFREEGGLADGGEANKGDAGVCLERTGGRG